MTLPVLVWTALDFFGGGELKCFHCWICHLLLGSKWWHHISSPVMIHEKRILFLVVLLQMTQTCSHSVNHLSLCQLMRNPLHTNFLELQVIFDNGMHGAMANADLNTHLFLCDSSVFSDQTINSCNHIRHNGSVGLSRAQITLQ